MAGITLINPPERLRVWAGIPKAHAHGVYCFPPLGLMHIQAAIEKLFVSLVCRRGLPGRRERRRVGELVPHDEGSLLLDRH